MGELLECKVFLWDKPGNSWVEIRFKSPLLKSLFLTKEECRLASARGEAFWKLIELFANGKKPSLNELSKVEEKFGEGTLRDSLQILEEVLGND